MFNVYFLNSNEESRVVGTANNWEEIFGVINNFLDEHNFKSYYTRTFTDDNKLFFDVGSWSEFFYVNKNEVGDLNAENI